MSLEYHSPPNTPAVKKVNPRLRSHDLPTTPRRTTKRSPLQATKSQGRSPLTPRKSAACNMSESSKGSPPGRSVVSVPLATGSDCKESKSSHPKDVMLEVSAQESFSRGGLVEASHNSLTKSLLEIGTRETPKSGHSPVNGLSSIAGNPSSTTPSGADTSPVSAQRNVRRSRSPSPSLSPPVVRQKKTSLARQRINTPTSSNKSGRVTHEKRFSNGNLTSGKKNAQQSRASAQPTSHSFASSRVGSVARVDGLPAEVLHHDTANKALSKSDDQVNAVSSSRMSTHSSTRQSIKYGYVVTEDKDAEQVIMGTSTIGEAVARQGLIKRMLTKKRSGIVDKPKPRISSAYGDTAASNNRKNESFLGRDSQRRPRPTSTISQLGFSASSHNLNNGPPRPATALARSSNLDSPQDTLAQTYVVHGSDMQDRPCIRKQRSSLRIQTAVSLAKIKDKIKTFSDNVVGKLLDHEINNGARTRKPNDKEPMVQGNLKGPRLQHTGQPTEVRTYGMVGRDESNSNASEVLDGCKLTSVGGAGKTDQDGHVYVRRKLTKENLYRHSSTGTLRRTVLQKGTQYRPQSVMEEATTSMKPDTIDQPEEIAELPVEREENLGGCGRQDDHQVQTYAVNSRQLKLSLTSHHLGSMDNGEGKKSGSNEALNGPESQKVFPNNSQAKLRVSKTRERAIQNSNTPFLEQPDGRKLSAVRYVSSSSEKQDDSFTSGSTSSKSKTVSVLKDSGSLYEDHLEAPPIPPRNPSRLEVRVEEVAPQNPAPNSDVVPAVPAPSTSGNGPATADWDERVLKDSVANMTKVLNTLNLIADRPEAAPMVDLTDHVIEEVGKSIHRVQRQHIDLLKRQRAADVYAVRASTRCDLLLADVLDVAEAYGVEQIPSMGPPCV